MENNKIIDMLEDNKEIIKRLNSIVKDIPNANDMEDTDNGN